MEWQAAHSQELGKEKPSWPWRSHSEMPRASLTRFPNQPGVRNNLTVLVKTLMAGSNPDLLNLNFSGHSLDSTYLTEKTKKHCNALTLITLHGPSGLAPVGKFQGGIIWLVHPETGVPGPSAMARRAVSENPVQCTRRQCQRRRNRGEQGNYC